MKRLVLFWPLALWALFALALLGPLAGAALVGHYFAVVALLGPAALLLFAGVNATVCGVLNLGLATLCLRWSR